MRLWSARCLLRPFASVITPRCHIASKNAKLKPKSVELNNIVKKVQPFGRIVVDLPYDVEIKPTNPHDYPDMDTLLIKLFSKDNFDEKLKDEELVSVRVADETCEIHAKETDDVARDVKCLIQTPVRYDVEVRTVGDADVEVHGMISDSINVQTEFGSIVGSQLQGKKISLSSSEGGSVTVQKSIQGNIEINTAKDGSVDAEKCLGTQLDISTEYGSVKLGSNYCEKSTFTTLDGDLNLNNLHMDSSIDIHGKGTLNISCFDGSLQANLGEGSASIQLARITADSSITSNGEVKVTVPEDLNAKLVLKSPELEIDTKVKGTHKTDKDVKEFISEQGDTEFLVESSKKVLVKQMSWMETFQLQNTPK